MNRVIVLGAGFSRAVSGSMPLTDEVGRLIFDKLKEPHPQFTGGYFEAWLSRLSEPQPDLADHVNASNHALFLRITRALHEVMVERELVTLAESYPPWLMHLVSVLHAEKATVITFNYDTLVEKAVDKRRLQDWYNRSVVGSGHIVNELPPLPTTPGMRWGPTLAESFTLLKLHGSLDVYWVQNDMSGATINRWISLGRWGTPEPPDERQRIRELPGRVPFLVPPAAAKSAFYGNPLTRQLWQSAAEALSAADTISLVGYSLPATDLVTSGMLADSLKRRAVNVEIVNFSPDDVAERVIALGASPDLLTKYAGGRSVEEFVTALERERVPDIVEQLEKFSSQSLLLAAANDIRAAAITRIDRVEDVVKLHAEPLAAMVDATRAQFMRTDPPLTLLHLMEKLRSQVTSRVVVVTDRGQELDVIDVTSVEADIGAGDGLWTVLVLPLDPHDETGSDGSIQVAR